MTKVWVPVAYGSALVSYNFAQQPGWSFAPSDTPRAKLQATWWQNARAARAKLLELAGASRAMRTFTVAAGDARPSQPSIAQLFTVNTEYGQASWSGLLDLKVKTESMAEGTDISIKKCMT